MKPEEGAADRLSSIRKNSPNQSLEGARRSKSKKPGYASDIEILRSINNIFQASLDCETEEQIGSVCLDLVMEVTGAKIGFIGILTNEGFLDDLAMIAPVSNHNTATVHHKALKGFKISGLYGRVIIDGRSLLTNDPASHPYSSGTPAGHPPIASFLGVPLIEQGKTIGMVAIANRDGGFDLYDQTYLESLTPIFVQVLSRKRVDISLRESETEKAFLLALSDALRPLEDPIEIQGAASHLLSKHIGNVQASYSIYNEETGTILIEREFIDGTGPILAGEYQIKDFSHAIGVLRSGNHLVISDVLSTSELPSEEVLRWIELNTRASISVPLIKSGRLIADLTVRSSNPRRWTSSEILLVSETAERTWAAVERARAVKELRISNQNKDQFLSTLSHELRNPLASIMMGTSIMNLAQNNLEKSDRALKIMERQTLLLSHLVDDLLDVTRISQDKIELKKETLELNELVSRTAEDQRPMFNEEEINLEVSLYPYPIYLQADPHRLVQVIGNLLHNALKFTARGDTAWVNVYRDDSDHSAVVEVVDNGRGIAPELLPCIFDPFIQADKSLDQHKGGLGLGLAIVNGIMNLHGGSVIAHSEGFGTGARFTIRLPIPQRAVSKPGIRRNDTVKNSHSLRVMVVDDIPDVAEVLSELLMRIGHVVTSAGDGYQALAKANMFVPEVVFCDIGLPGMTGYEVARAFRNDELLKDTYLIALSGYNQENDLALSYEAGFDKHLAKPVDLDTIRKTLGEVR